MLGTGPLPRLARLVWTMPLVVGLAVLSACGAQDASKQGASTAVAARPSSAEGETGWWLTKSDRSALVARQAAPLTFGAADDQHPSIDVDPATTFQTIDGFGYTLTGGSASVIHGLNAADRAALLAELFGRGPNGIGIDYLRLSIGASDLNSHPFTYDDLPPGQTDPELKRFSLAPDEKELLPLLKEILKIHPKVRFMAAPWSAPLWMKTNGSFKGGSLAPEHEGAYARYFVKYVQQMKAAGITIDAVTPQNEPLNPKNVPSLEMDAASQGRFVRDHLGPAFRDAGLATKIVLYDHNCNRPDYPLSILDDARTRAFVVGSAFHLYEGDIRALTTVHDTHPDKDIYFTEQWTGAKGTFAGDLMWHARNVIIGSMRNWSRIALEWNLANDPSYGPHTIGGCDECLGALTIGPSVVRNVGYYIIAHASKFVPSGSIRIASTEVGSLYDVAFRTPAGRTVLIVANDGPEASFNIRVKNGAHAATSAPAHLPAKAVATYVW